MLDIKEYLKQTRSVLVTQDAFDELMQRASAQPDIVRCKDCNKASKCYGEVVMRSRGGGNIYCPLEFCSEAERRNDGM